MLELDKLLPGDVVQDPNLMENNHSTTAAEILRSSLRTTGLTNGIDYKQTS